MILASLDDAASSAHLLRSTGARLDKLVSRRLDGGVLQIVMVFLMVIAMTGAGPSQASGPLAAIRIVGDSIQARLTEKPGDPQRGRLIATNPSQGNCTICHTAPVADVPVFGNLGPSLAGVGSRLTEAQLRLRMVDARRLNPQSLMPAYHAVDGLRRVPARLQGTPLLEAQDIEDVVAWLLTLREAPKQP